LPEGGKVVILRALPGLGDTLCAIPSVRAIKRSRPDLSITVLTNEQAIPYWRRYPEHVDRVIAFPGWPGLPERKPDIARIPGFLAEMQAEHFDLAIQLHGEGRIVNQIVALLGARRSAGYHPPVDQSTPAGTWLPWRDGVSEIRRGLRLMTALGFPDDDESLEFSVARGVVTQGGIVRELFPTSATRRTASRWPSSIPVRPRWAGAGPSNASRGSRTDLPRTGCASPSPASPRSARWPSVSRPPCAARPST